MKHSIQLLCAFVFAAVSGLSAQTLKVPAPSPLQTLKQAFALSEVTISTLVHLLKVVSSLVMLFLTVKSGALALTVLLKLLLAKMLKYKALK